ncbi:MAG: DUF5723 family protein [Prevotellaceae bacterium]|jgi:hypothetical protein|nr:DUF5723 family protein [Prevotellaceae bacterium]
MKRISTILYSIPVLAGACLSHHAYAQESTLMHFINQSPQSLHTNPANLSNDVQWFMGIPVLGGLHFDANSDVSYNDLFLRTSDNIIRIKPSAVDKIASSARLLIAGNAELLSFGFKVHPNHMITFSTSVVADGSALLPGDAAKLLILGNTPGEQLNFGAEANLLGYLETALGYSLAINESWKIGARAKLLLGAANIYLHNMRATLDTDPVDYSMRLHMNAIARTSNVETALNDPSKILPRLFDNTGFAVDFGIHYQTPVEGLSIGLSAIDWGWINWKSDLKFHEATLTNDEFVFAGLTDLNGSFEQIKDTLNNLFDFEERAGKPYRTPLPGKIYLSAIYNLTPDDKLGFLFGTRAMDNFSRTTFTLMYNRSVGKWLSVSLGNNFMLTKIFNPSMAINLRGGAFQFFLSVENISSISVSTARTVGVHLGFNLTFNSKPQPVVIEEEQIPRFYNR